MEKTLLKELLTLKELKDVTHCQITGDNGEVYLEYRTITQPKDGGIPKQKDHKRKITKFVQKHGGVIELYEAIVASSMILHNYSIVPIENGWLCVGGNEIYNMKQQECTCTAFQRNKNTRCKHLVFRDWTVKQRARVAEIKSKL